MIDNTAIADDQMETQTNGRYQEDVDLGNTNVLYPNKKLDEYETRVYRGNTSQTKFELGRALFTFSLFKLPHSQVDGGCRIDISWYTNELLEILLRMI